MMNERNYEINNIDTLIILEEPKLAPYLSQMQNNIAHLLHTEKENINIKATRGEKLGFIGNKQGALAEAIVLLRKKENTWKK